MHFISRPISVHKEYCYFANFGFQAFAIFHCFAALFSGYGTLIQPPICKRDIQRKYNGWRVKLSTRLYVLPILQSLCTICLQRVHKNNSLFYFLPFIVLCCNFLRKPPTVNCGQERLDYSEKDINWKSIKMTMIKKECIIVFYRLHLCVPYL
jgi:hypothetical protein